MKLLKTILLAALLSGCGDAGAPDGGHTIVGPVAGHAGVAGQAGASGSGGATAGHAGDGGSGGLVLEDCEPLNVTEPFVTVNAVAGIGSVVASELERGEGTDLLMLEFYQFTGPQEAGDYDLAASPDSNYETCERCVRVLFGIEEQGPQTVFYQVEGTLSLEVPDAVGDSRSKGSLEGLVLVEVTVDPYSYRSTPVPAGACLEVAPFEWDLTLPEEDPEP